MNIRVPVSWLREYVKTDVANKTIANLLSQSGPSVERIEPVKNDYIFDIEVTSNRPDAFSVWGLAREINAVLCENGIKTRLTAPKGLGLSLEPDVSQNLKLHVTVKNKNLCPRFTAIVLDNITIKPSPAFMKNRLEANNVRPINNIVDISNYLMLELGQPMHTFDWDKLKGQKMILRSSRPGEKIKTLDGKVRKPPAGSIVIEDESRLIDLCGIMGGTNTQITTRTKRVVFFAQSYNPWAIRKTTHALAFRTEAASRFEKEIDQEEILPALSRAVYLAKKIASARIASELVDIYQKKPQAEPVSLSIVKLNRYLGFEISWMKAVDILRSLGFKAKIVGQTLTATPPSWRHSDITEDVDLIEEIARVYGYWRLPSKLPSGQVPEVTRNEIENVIRLKKALIYLGLTEVMSYSIISEEFLALTGRKKREIIELANPLTSEWQYMRPTILISLASIIHKNQHLKSDLKIFEIAKTYSWVPNDLPEQELMLSVILQGSDFFQIKGLVENILLILNREAKWQKLIRDNPLFEKELTSEILIGDQQIGIIGIMASKINEYFGIEKKVAACEINLSQLLKTPLKPKVYKPIPKYPPVIEDISAVFDLELPLAELVAGLKKAGPLLAKVEVIDVFQDKKLGKNKKSLTLRLTYRKSSGTPKASEVARVRNKIISLIEKLFEAKIRK